MSAKLTKLTGPQRRLLEALDASPQGRGSHAYLGRPHYGVAYRLHIAGLIEMRETGEMPSNRSYYITKAGRAMLAERAKK